MTQPSGSSNYWSLHTHSRYSVQDALPSPKDIVDRAAQLGYKGLALTDHGNMAGAIEFYQACMAANIKPFIGTEFYFCPDRELDRTGKRWHLGLIAYTEQGYRNMIRINTWAHTHFRWKPTIDLSDMANFHEWGWTEGIALTTGCYFGYVIQTLITEGFEAAKRIVATFSSWFRTYVEIQCHEIDQEPMSEEEISDALVKIADDLNLLMVITQDSHYIHPEEQSVHNTLKALVSFSKDGDDAVFPGDGYHMVDDQWMYDHHGEDKYWRGIEGLNDLLDAHTLRIPEADVYQYRIPQIYDEPDLELRASCQDKLSISDPAYKSRLEEELSVIADAGMSSYMLLVRDVCQYMKENGINFQTRGSAGGSLVCYFLGITNFDPIQWGARFDRFLTRDRSKPPDVDLDIDSRRRAEVLEWLSERFAVAQLGTWATLSMDDDEEEGDGSKKGILLTKLYAKKRSELVEQGYSPEKIKELLQWSRLPRETRENLVALNEAESFAQFGTHTCGLALLNSKEELMQMVPMMRASGGRDDEPRLVTQYDGDVCESIGIVKLDVLGLRTMAVLAETAKNLGWNVSDLHKGRIPLDDKDSYAMIARGDTGGVFQLEGYTARNGVRELRPQTIHDVIAAMALFRPGVMNSGATRDFMNRKHGREELPDRHPVIKKFTDQTQGILLYQDQVIAILREIGMDTDDVNVFLKAVKASNKKVAEAEKTMDHYRPIIDSLCAGIGMDQEDRDWLEHAFDAFANYSFNLAHATVYGLTAYRCAWLAKNHPVEFHAALLACSSEAGDLDKEMLYTQVAKSRRVKIYPPDLNQSKLVHSVAKDGVRKIIRKGFLSIKGLGLSAANPIIEGQPYADVDDFLDRVSTKVTGTKDFVNGVSNEDDLIGVMKLLHENRVFKTVGGIEFGEGNQAAKDARKRARQKQAAFRRWQKEFNREERQRARGRFLPISEFVTGVPVWRPINDQEFRSFTQGFL